MDPGIAREVVVAVQRALVARGAPVGDLVPDEPDQLVVAGAIADAVFDRAAEALGDPAIGITTVSAIPIGGLGVIDYTLCTSANMREALRKVGDHYGVATQRVKFGLAEADGRATVGLERVAGLVHSRHWIEFSLAMMGQRLRQCSGVELVFDEVGFAHPAPAEQAAHDALFGTRVAFGMPTDRVSFSAKFLDQPLHTASASLASLLDLRIRELAPQLAALDPLLDRARRTLAAMLDERRTEIDELVRRLGTSKRSLQRSLGELGTSHSVLLDQLRRERAVQLLDRGMKVADVATALGFTAPSAFFRAYRRWTGTSPKGQRDPDPEPGDSPDADADGE